jgi:pyruvate dehydrogenase E2 component (dihydrolipoamide acetyltransferase)
MAEIIRMPRLSDTMEEGNIVAWLKKEGDPVKAGDILAEVETDKATMELESYFDGVLLYIGVPSGQVAVDGIIAIIGKKGEEFKHLITEQKPSLSKVEEKMPVQDEKSQADPISPKKVVELVKDEPITLPSSGEQARTKASPLAKSIANEAGIDIDLVSGSGDQGRIIKKDVENYITNKPVVTPTFQTPEAQTISLATNFEYGDVPVSQMRKTIARRLGESKFTAPHFYLTIEINMDNAVTARQSINEQAESKISFNDFVIKAVASALRKHPKINSSWFGDKITYHRDINIGVAVAVEEGLLVPVINHADLKSMTQINTEVKSLAQKAKTKKLTPQEMQGNTFTISNLGMFGIVEYTAIINPPDACILAVGSIVEKPIVTNGQIVIAHMMHVTLSCDHRVVDGATGAQFLQTLKAMLENPVLMIV